MSRRRLGLILQRRSTTNKATAADANAAALEAAADAATGSTTAAPLPPAQPHPVFGGNDSHSEPSTSTMPKSSAADHREEAKHSGSEDDIDLEENMDEEDTQDWQRVLPTRRNRTTKADRVSRTRFLLQLRPLAKIQIRTVPKQAIANIIGLTAPSAELAEMASVTYDDAANSARIRLYDESHVVKMLKIDRLTFRKEDRKNTIEIAIDRMDLNRNTIRGVIQIDRNDTPEKIFNWLRCEQTDILKVQKIGKSDRAIVTFDGTTLPRVVKYYMELVKVDEYKPKRLVCFNCHNLGHMARFCPSIGVCRECGRSHPDTDDCASTVYCVACKEVGHLAVSKVCPSRLPQEVDRRTDQSTATKRSTNRSLGIRPGVRWADVIAPADKQQHGTPDNNGPNNDDTKQKGQEPLDLSLENAHLKRQLTELRTELQQIRQELQSLRHQAAQQIPRRPSSSPGPPASGRRSRSRAKKRTPTTQFANTTESKKLVTTQMLTQRDAQLKFEASRELQKAFSGIHELQGLFNTLTADIRQLTEQMRGFLQSTSPEQAKRKKVQQHQ